MTIPASAQPQIVRELDPLKVAEFQERLRAEQNPLLGLVAGGMAALIGAGLWAAVTVITKYQIGWMAIGVAFIVGLAIRVFGKGVDKFYSFLGAGLALVAVILGNLLMLAVLLAQQESVSLLIVLGVMLTNPALDMELLAQNFSFFDLLFYGFAVYYGYRYSTRQITPAEREALYSARTVIS